MAYISKHNTRDGIKPIGSNLHGTCSTSASTAEKSVSMSDFDVLVEGVTIHVYFSYSNTAASPQLKVGSTDAKPIRRNGYSSVAWDSGGVYSFTYHNGYWYMNDQDAPPRRESSSVYLNVPGNGQASATVTVPTIEGYKFVGIIGYRLMSSSLHVYDLYPIDDTRYYIGVENNFSAGVAGTNYVYLLYLPK